MSSAVAAVIDVPGGEFRLESVELDDIRDDEMLVRVEACGVCHTDVEAQGKLTPLPAVMGHEGAGIVEAVGRCVRRVRPGDRVVVSYPSCGTCENCAAGSPFICDQIIPLCFDGHRADGSQPISLRGNSISSAFFQQSSFATHAITPERNVVRVSDGTETPILASLPCGIQTGAGAVMNTFRATAGSSLAVFGVGSVGLSAIMMARVMGVSPLIAVDVHPARLALAGDLGATVTINATDGEVSRRIRELAPRGVSFSLETSGNEQSLNDAIASLMMGGTCGIVTAPHWGEKYPFSPTELMVRIASLRGIAQGSSVPTNFIPKLLDLQRQGRFPVDRLIKTYKFEDINQAFRDLRDGLAIKPVLVMQ